MQQMFQCSRCGAQNYIGQGYCWNCNERFQYNCPYCTTAVDPSMQHCPYCRSVLPWPVQPQPAPVAPGNFAPNPPVQGPVGYGQNGQDYQYGQMPEEPPKKRVWLIALASVIAVAGLALAAVNLLGLMKQPSVPGQQAAPPQIQQSAPVHTYDNTFDNRF